MNAVVEGQELQLPAPVTRRGISEAQWRTLKNSLYPGAASESIVAVIDYCKARGLDPLKKPVHIVPMCVRDAKSGSEVWRDVVMPGIYEYRTTAMRTGFYIGHSIPEYGPAESYLGVTAPAYVNLTVYRWNPASGQRGEFPVQIRFSEVVATRYDKKAEKTVVNARWTKAPQQMLTKCAEAAALREAFPAELGGTHTDDELAGQVVEAEPQQTPVNPRPDTSAVDWEARDKWVSRFTDIINSDNEEKEISRLFAEADEELQSSTEMAIVVFDKLAEGGIISKANYRATVKAGREALREPL